MKAGEILAVVGPNGSGKTTLFNVVSGFHRATSGTVTFAGTAIAAMRAARINRLGLARTFQQAMAFVTFTVRENLELARLTHRSDPSWRGPPRTSRAGGKRPTPARDPAAHLAVAKTGEGVSALPG